MERLVRITRHLRPGGRIRFVTIFLLLAILGIGGVAECAPSVSASLDPGIFAVDQSATLAITVNDAGGTIDELPEVDGLIFQRRGQTSQHQIVNGSLSSSVATVFQVQASRPGTFTIPSIPVTVDGKELQTDPITLEVTPAVAGVSSPAGEEVGQLAFLRVSPVKAESYVGEVLPLEIKAYFRRGLRASLNSRPRLSGDGFVFTPSRQEPVQTEEMVDNVPYSVLTWTGSLSGVKEGHHLQSAAIDATLLLPGRNRRSVVRGGDPFLGNDLFADFFNQQQLQEKKVQLVSKDMTLAVLPLPTEGRPAGFSGAIGRFELQVQAQPTDVGPGDPITLTMTVQGRGNFDRVDAPVLSQEEGWKSYPPSAKFTPGTDPGQGSKLFAQALIAKGADKTAIPPLSFSFFDPEAGKYQTVHSDPIALRISKAEDGQKSEGSSPADAGQGRPDAAGTRDGGSGGQGRPDAAALNLVPQHSQIGSLQQGLIPLVSRTGFQMVILSSLLLLVAVILFKIRARRQAGDPLLCRRREMVRLLDIRLREIKECRERGDSRDFLAGCRRAMQEQLGMLWQTGPGAITLADLRQSLAADSELIALFATAESGAYGDSYLSRQEMDEYAGKLEQELRKLQ